MNGKYISCNLQTRCQNTQVLFSNFHKKCYEMLLQHYMSEYSVSGFRYKITNFTRMRIDLNVDDYCTERIQE